MFAVSTAATMWLCSPYSAIRKTHFPLFAMTFGLGFGKMATKIIYAHLCKRPFPYHSGLMLPLFVGSVLVNLPSIFPNINITHWMEVVYLYLWFIIAIVGYGHWSYHVVRSFCGFLGIDCFRIKQKSN
jgi:ethanolaminephosphotransferase